MRLVLFMTYGMSLKNWETAGILERELELYRKYVELGHAVTIVSYGGLDDLEIANRFPFIKIIINRWRVPKALYSLLLQVKHSKEFAQSDVFKTNQLYGAHVGLRIGTIFQKPVVVRQGYSYVDHKIYEACGVRVRSWLPKQYEKRNLLRASLLIFTTEEIRKSSFARIPKLEISSAVVPNYVEPRLWSPQHVSEEVLDRARIVYFGRFAKQKNLETLILASVGLPVELILIGDGPLLNKIQCLAREKEVACCFPGRLPQKQIVEILRGSTAFVLPSHYEGHPKSLIEAMVFGIPIVAANSPGIREHVDHRVDGILSESTVKGLHHGMKEMIGLSVSCRTKIGGNARKIIL